MRRLLAFLALLLLPHSLFGKAPEVKVELEGDWRVVGMEAGDRSPCPLQALAIVHLATLAQDAVKDLAHLVQTAEKAHAENRCSMTTLGGITPRECRR